MTPALMQTGSSSQATVLLPYAVAADRSAIADIPPPIATPMDPETSHPWSGSACGADNGVAIRGGFAFAAAGIPSLTEFAKTFSTLRDQKNPADRLSALDIGVSSAGFRQGKGLIDYDLQLAARGLVDQALNHVMRAVGG